jgi:hypothetical protein
MCLVYAPSALAYIYYSLRARSFFFYSATNPSIENGGMFFESKMKVYQLLPPSLIPTTILIEKEDDVTIALQKMNDASLNFPVIAKPNRGERGWFVKKIKDKSGLEAYRKHFRNDFIIQKYIDFPLELSVFFIRHPNKENGFVTSITEKKLLSVIGDGYSTLGDLIIKNDRAFLQLKALQSNREFDFNIVLKNQEAFVLVPYGNHVRGAEFIDRNDWINDKVNEVFNKICKNIDGFYFGRFDLKCTEREDLSIGNNLMVVELNGAGAEPAHIYDKNFRFFSAQKVLFRHFGEMYRVAIANHKRGVTFLNAAQFFMLRKEEKMYKKNL